MPRIRGNERLMHSVIFPEGKPGKRYRPGCLQGAGYACPVWPFAKVGDGAPGGLPAAP